MALRIGRYRYSPAPVPTVVGLVLVTVLVALGSWQLRRAEEKAALADVFEHQAARPPRPVTGEVLDPRPLAAAPLFARGRYDAARQFLLDNRTHQGVAGYHVLSVLGLDDGGGLLVNRGWIPSPPDRSVKPDVTVVERSIIARGTGALPREDQFVLGDAGYGAGADWPRVVQRIEIAEMERLLGRPLLPLVLNLGANEPDGYLREWTPYVGIGPARHRGYAVQWFALAATLLAIHLALSVRRNDGRR